MTEPLLPTPRRAIVRRPSAAAPDGLTRGDRGPVDPTLTLRQHDAYVAALRAAGLHVTVLPPLDEHPDGHFVEDTAVLLGPDLAVVTTPGAASRRGEVDTIAAALPHPQIVRLADVGGASATLDGGDVLVCADRVLIGVSARTNTAGALALTRVIAQHHPDWTVSVVPVHGVLHLKTGMTEVTPGTLLRAPHLRPPADLFTLAGLRVIDLPAAEAYGANVLPLGVVTLVPAGLARVVEIAGRHAEVIEVEMSELEKRDGGLTCLSLRW